MLDRTKALIVLALVAIIFIVGGAVQGWRVSGQHAQELAKRDRQALEVAEAIKQAGIEANNAISAADARAWKGLEDDKKELGRLRGCVAAGTCGVRLITKHVSTGATRVRASLGVRHAWGNLSQNRNMAFEGSSSFTVAGAPLARNTALVGLQAEMALSRYSALVLGYNCEYGSGSRDQSASVKVRWAY